MFVLVLGLLSKVGGSSFGFSMFSNVLHEVGEGEPRKAEIVGGIV
jgi:hypothetical protein